MTLGVIIYSFGAFGDSPNAPNHFLPTPCQSQNKKVIKECRTSQFPLITSVDPPQPPFKRGEKNFLDKVGEEYPSLLGKESGSLDKE